MSEETLSQLKNKLTEMMNLLDKLIPVSVNSKDLFRFDSNFEKLIKNGADVNIQDEDGNTPLHYANTTEQMKLLLDAGANINQQNNQCGGTPLHWANTFEQLKFLIDSGADPNIQDNRGFTPIFFCENTLKEIEELLKANPDLTLKNKDGLTAKEYLLKNNKLNHVKIIEDYEKEKFIEKLKEENEKLKEEIENLKKNK